MPSLFKQSKRKDIPENFSEETANTVCRIDENHHVIGVLYLERNLLVMCTVHESLGQVLAAKLPIFTGLVQSAICEIDVLDTVLAYRIETKSTELLVAPAEHHAACVIHKKRSAKPKQH